MVHCIPLGAAGPKHGQDEGQHQNISSEAVLVVFDLWQAATAGTHSTCRKITLLVPHLRQAAMAYCSSASSVSNWRRGGTACGRLHLLLLPWAACFSRCRRQQRGLLLSR